MIEVRLAQFEGPLDLLLHLIEKAELDIADIFVSDITQQYLAMMKQIDEVQLESGSEFLAMAATLLYIKSRSLLPRKQPVSEEEEDPEQALLHQIREYKACKEASELLKTLAEQAEKIYTRLPEEYPLPPPRVELIGIPIERLYETLALLLLNEKESQEAEEAREVQKDLYSIGDCMDRIRTSMLRDTRCRFDALFPNDGGRMGIIVTFMAMLELVSKNELRLVQQNSYEPIWVEMIHVAQKGSIS